MGSSATVSAPSRTRISASSVTCADHLGMQLPAREVLLHRLLAAGAHQQQHALLRLGEHHLERRKPRLAPRHARHVDLDPQAATRRHLDRRRRQPRRTKVLHGDDVAALERARHASSSSFSRNGLPTCTTPRCDASGSSLDANAAPCSPSRPVSAPTSSSGLPAPDARARVSRAIGAMPTHIAFTIGLPV